MKEIIGSGPYRFRADLHEPGVKIVLDKFADYRPRSEPPLWASGAKIARMDRVCGGVFLALAGGLTLLRRAGA